MKKRFGIGLLLFALLACRSSADIGNTIRKSDFNFGHQLGYLYSRADSAYFGAPGSWTFETGFLDFYTSRMPLVENPDWRTRTMLLVPLSFEIFPCSGIALQADLTDLFAEFPYKGIHNMGGKSPRFKTKMRLCREGAYLPATAFTVGVKFSSAKPYTIWANKHNYQESNGLAGACTGEADYLLLFTFSKRLSDRFTAHARLGLAPLGSPVEYERGSGQADEIPYGLTLETRMGEKWTWRNGVLGMKNGLSSTRLAHYSVARTDLSRGFGKTAVTLNLEKGLTRESDEWVAGFYVKFFFMPRE